MTAPRASFRHLGALWIQVTGTWCNLTCNHCFNSSGPKDPWIGRMEPAQVRAAIDEGASLGVKEIYYTGGEPFLHPDILGLTEYGLRHAPTTILTNGTLISEPMAGRLGALAAAARYSLEVRLSLDASEREANDTIRGKGVFDKVLQAARTLETHGLLPIITVSEIATPSYARLRDMLLAAGIRRPRLKIIPVFPMGRLARASWMRCGTSGKALGRSERRPRERHPGRRSWMVGTRSDRVTRGNEEPRRPIRSSAAPGAWRIARSPSALSSDRPPLLRMHRKMREVLRLGPGFLSVDPGQDQTRAEVRNIRLVRSGFLHRPRAVLGHS